MADAGTLRTRQCRRPIVVAPSVYDALTDTKELPALGPRYDAPVQPTDNRSGLPG